MDFSNLLSMAPEIWQASLETALMLGIGLTVAIVLGGPLGIVLFLTQPGQLWAHRALNGVLGWLVNLVRSFPFIILMVSLVPLTRLLVGSTIGPVAAAVPLSFAAIPYFARLVEQTLREVPRGVLEAAEAMGASPWQIIRKVLINEARAWLVGSLGTATVLPAFTAASAFCLPLYRPSGPVGTCATGVSASLCSLAKLSR